MIQFVSTQDLANFLEGKWPAYSHSNLIHGPNSKQPYNSSLLRYILLAGNTNYHYESSNEPTRDTLEIYTKEYVALIKISGSFIT